MYYETATRNNEMRTSGSNLSYFGLCGICVRLNSIILFWQGEGNTTNHLLVKSDI